MAWVDFRELREKLDFREVLRHYRVETKAGNKVQHHGPCPLPGHQGQRRGTSFSAQLDRGIWKCFGCGSQGNVLDFACRMENLDPTRPEDIRRTALLLSQRYGIESQKPKSVQRKPVVPAKQQVLVNAPLDFALKDLDPDHPYLRGRGFTKETIARFELGFCSRGLMKDRIAIPLKDAAGKLVGYAGRVVDDSTITEENPKYRFPAARDRDGKRYEFSKSLFLYNGSSISTPADELVIVEGFPSVWWLHQHGITHVMGLMGGKCSAKQAALIVGIVPRRGKIWIMPNGDQSGRYCAESLLKQLSPFRAIRWPELKDGKKPTDLSADELRERLA